MARAKPLELSSFRRLLILGAGSAVVFAAMNFSRLPRASAQSTSDRPLSFDVASLKQAQPSPPYPINLGRTLRGTTELTNITLAQALRFAFGFKSDDQISGPEWVKSVDTLFVIVAKAPPETPPEKIRLMTLNLLTDRFNLKLHQEKREIAYFALVVDKKGAKLHEGSNAPAGAVEVRSGRIVLPRASMATLIAALGTVGTGRPIVDMTELKGLYAVKLEWTPVNRGVARPDGVGDPAPLPAGPTIFDAITEQLGLRLEMRKGPMDVVVVDSVNRIPIPN
jgi:uncharacterized protein (TIGR03435 family)